MPEEVEGTFAVAEVGGVADGFGDKVFGVADGLDGGIAEDEVAEEGGGEGASGAVSGGGVEVLAGEPVEISRGEAEDIGGLGMVSGGGDDVEMGVPGGQMPGGELGLGEGFDGLGGEGGELEPVGGDPGHKGEELVVEEVDGAGWKEVVAGAGAEDGIEHDEGRGGGPIPCLGLPFLGADGSEKTRDSSGDFAGAEHPDLDARGGQVGDQVVEGAAEEGGVGGEDFGDAEGGLDGEGGDGGGAEEAVGGEGLEVGGNAGAGGGVVACDGQEGAGWGGGNGWILRHGRATPRCENPIIHRGILQPKIGNNYL